MKIAFLGGGHMTAALIAALHQTADITVADRNAEKRQQLAEKYQVTAVAALPATLKADAVVLAVRPPQALAACAALPPDGLLISVVAGLRTAQLAAAAGREAAAIVRVMPNTPSQVGWGMTFGYADAAAAADKALVEQLFSAVGKFSWVEREMLLEAATAVSGSAPAYIYYVIDAMLEAAAELELDAETAQAAIVQTIRGACAMVEQSGQTPAALTAAVAVPGGTTAEALAVMQQAEMRRIIGRAMAACARRAREMGDELARQS